MVCSSGWRSTCSFISTKNPRCEKRSARSMTLSAVKFRAGYRACGGRLPPCQRSTAESRNVQNYFSKVLAFSQQSAGFGDIAHRQYVADDRMQVALRNPRRKLLPGLLHDLAIRREICQPESMYTGALGVENARIELRALAGGVAVDDHTAKIAQAADAFGSMLAAQHLEDDIHAFAVGQITNGLFVVLAFVVDRMLEAESLNALQLFVRRRRAIHIKAQQFANLHRGGANASCNSMDEHARHDRSLCPFLS